ncbi:hypothetical protein [Micromonospora carbonacea]|uniref:Uncharacterized protein n=1 Tax=Micromonospora carbonacea TaxID=47853 RepID=A0A1C4WT40_9ACTN|nr:hypothetical protein [Micromonospora carbonacea]SCE99344.1 hypothetical protein GA0070563_1046 [Micromonospora carbonacea]
MTRSTANRRAKTKQRRDHRVGPLRFNDDELRLVQLAADKAGLSVGAYVTAAAVRAACGDLHPGPPEGELRTELHDIRTILALLRWRLDMAGRDKQAELVNELLTEAINATLHQQAGAPAGHPAPPPGPDGDG